MRKPKTLKTLITVLLWVAVLCAGCRDGRTDGLLSQIDTLTEARPDSALRMLDSLGGEKPNWSRRLRMRYDLLHLKAENKAFVPLTSDSVARNLVDYYDTWGNDNERMTAHYLLGCVYRDKGDSPQAIDCYLDAVAQADTTSKDCDFRTLSRIYEQMLSANPAAKRQYMICGVCSSSAFQIKAFTFKMAGNASQVSKVTMSGTSLSLLHSTTRSLRYGHGTGAPGSTLST